MNDPFIRTPFALANWKMAITISESLVFVDEFCRIAGDLVQAVEVVICPPYTGLHGLAQALADTPIALGAQDLCAAPGKAHTGQVSAPLLVDVGCEWVMLNHWEIRRRTGESPGHSGCNTQHGPTHGGSRDTVQLRRELQHRACRHADQRSGAAHALRFVSAHHQSAFQSADVGVTGDQSNP